MLRSGRLEQSRQILHEMASHGQEVRSDYDPLNAFFGEVGHGLRQSRLGKFEKGGPVRRHPGLTCSLECHHSNSLVRSNDTGAVRKYD